MASLVTDPEILAQLNADEKKPVRVTDPAILAQLEGKGESSPSVLTDVAKSGAIGVVKGGIGLAGMAGDLTNLGAKGLEHASNYISDKLGIDRYQRPDKPSALNAIPTSHDIQSGIEGYTGEFYKPKTKVGEYAQTLGEFAPGMIGGGGSLLAKGLTRVVAPALASEAAGQATKGGALEPWARVAGGLLGGIASPSAFRYGANLVQGGAEGMSRGASKHLVDALSADGPDLVKSRVSQLGPDATLLEGGPALLGKGQGASLNSDEGRSIMGNMLTGRDKATNSRVMGDVERVLGPAEDSQKVTNAIINHRSEVDSKAYPAALGAARPVDTAPIISDLDGMIEKSVGMEKKALTSLRDMMTSPAEKKAAETAAMPAKQPASSVSDDVEAIRAKYGDGAAAAYEKQQQPQSLLEFIHERGGLGPDAELNAIGAHDHVVNVNGLGRRKLVKQGGLQLDYAREAAEEAGYLTGKNGGTATPRDLLDAIDAEVRGQKRYPAGHEGYQNKNDIKARSERDQHEYDQHIRGLEDDITTAGYENVSPDVKKRAVNLMANDGLGVDEAMAKARERASAVPAAKTPERKLQDDASVLHKIKGELDNVIQYDAPGLGVPAGAVKNQQAALKQMRFRVNQALERQVEGYAAANSQSAALAKRGQAVEAGTQYLGSGKTTPSPERFAEEFSPLPHGEKIAFAKGSRGNIDRILGTKANDLQALRGELQGEGGWNTAKLATVHGQDVADALMGTVDRNLTFRNTHNKIVENSQTAQRNAAAKSMKPDASTETPLINPNMTMAGLPATIAKKAMGAALNMVRADPTKSFGEIAKVLTAQGPIRDAHLEALVKALSRGQENAKIGSGVARNALAAALLSATNQSNR